MVLTLKNSCKTILLTLVQYVYGLRKTDRELNAHERFGVDKKSMNYYTKVWRHCTSISQSYWLAPFTERVVVVFFVVYFVASMVSKWFGRNQRKVGTKNPEDFQKGTCASGARFHRWWPLKLAKDSSSYSMYYTGYTTVVVVVVFAYGKIVSDSYIWPIDISIKVINNKTEK